MLDTLIEQKLLKEQEERKDRERSGLYNPSMLGRCLKLQYLNRKNEPISNPPDTKALKKMKQGTYTHLLIQSHLPKEIIEVEVKTEHFLGYADIVLDSVMDIKSMEEWAFKRYWQRPQHIIEEENYNNFYQTVFYAIHLKKEWAILRANVFGSLLTYRDLKVKVDDWRQRIEAECKTLIQIWNSQLLPKGKPRAFGGRECNYCNWADTCKDKK